MVNVSDFIRCQTESAFGSFGAILDCGILHCLPDHMSLSLVWSPVPCCHTSNWYWVPGAVWPIRGATSPSACFHAVCLSTS